MSPPRDQRGPLGDVAQVPLPEVGVLRVSFDPARLPQARAGVVGPNRFDDPRPRTQDRYVMRYGASTLRGCLLELLDALRPLGAAAQREGDVVDDAPVPGPAEPPCHAVARYLTGRKVAAITSPDLSVVSINDPALQQLLDHVAAVRALLDTPAARAVLLPSGAGQDVQVRLDGAAVRLSSDLGRDLTRAASLVLRDLDPALGGIGYRSRHDDDEHCWAIYDHAPVEVSTATALSADNEEHRQALSAVATLWNLPLPPPWRGRPAPTRAHR